MALVRKHLCRFYITDLRFNMKDKLKGILPHIIAVVAFIVVSAIYFFPILEGQELLQSDDIHARGMAQELIEYENATGESSDWTGSMFGGMPAYQIKSHESFNIYHVLQRALRIFLPYTSMAIFFIYLLGFYFLLTALDLKRGIAIIGAFAFALSTYNIIIIAAGHITKCYAIAYMAPVLAGIIYVFNKRYFLGGLITAISLGIEISCNHPQILYYLAILCFLYTVYKAFEAFKEKSFPAFGKAFGVVAVAAILAVLPNITSLWTTWEYGKYSTRSQSELSNKQSSSGLDKDYALAWSCGVSESFQLFIPNFKGGETTALGNDENAMNAVKGNQLANEIANQNHYWGDQPFTSGPVYVGAIIFFLFVLGMFIVKSNAKWWLLGGTLVSLVLSWGQNIQWFTDIIFNLVPMYNKFRSVSMVLVIAQVCIPFLAMLAVKEIVDNPEGVWGKKNNIFGALALTAGVCGVFYLFPHITSMLSASEAVQLDNLINEGGENASLYMQFQEGLVDARTAVFRADVLRSLLFIVLGASVVILYLTKIIKNTGLMMVVLGALIVADLWMVDYRYLGPKDYKSSIETNVFKPTAADQLILKDNDPDFRVLNLTQNVFNDGITPYFHKTIGGYHGAKLRRYQEFIDTLLAPAVNAAMYVAKNNPEQLQSFVGQSPALNMLNTKFIITDPNQFPVVNLGSYGNAWFVNKFDLVENADKEIENLKRSDLLKTAVINKNLFASYIPNLPKEQIFAEDSSVISLAEYKPNYLKYNALAFRDRLAVFSEVYYPKGWQAYIDGNPVDHISADYILRAMVVPAGQHTIEFRFDPASVRIGSAIAVISSILVILAVAAYIYFVYSGKIKEEDNSIEKDKI